MPDHFLALDIGTTEVRAIVFDAGLRPATKAGVELEVAFPRPGWVETDPEDLWRRLLGCIGECLGRVPAAEIAAIGITNQRETAVLWDADTGEPAYPAIGWQDKRTADRCKALRETHQEQVGAKTGLRIDPYFSATKIGWALENADRVRDLARRERLRFGTVDTWVLWKLTDGAVFATEPSNASRTLLLDIHSLRWDPELAAVFGVDPGILPELRPSLGDFGRTTTPEIDGSIPVTAMLGDQQASLFGLGGFGPEVVKATYGTGLFALVSSGTEPAGGEGVLTTVAWQKAGEPPCYALEGSILSGGAAVQWLRDGLGIIRDYDEAERMAAALPDNGGVYFIPALAGLGAPYWDHATQGTLAGLTRGTEKAHIVRATLEGLAHQAAATLRAMQEALGTGFARLRTDGGGSRNDFLMQFQAELLGLPVERSRFADATARGAAAAAAVTTGALDEERVAALQEADRVFAPEWPETEREVAIAKWEAVLAEVRRGYHRLAKS